MNNIDELKKIIEADIQETNKYEAFLDIILADIGMDSYTKLKFTNLGFRLAMEKVQRFLEEKQ